MEREYKVPRSGRPIVHIVSLRQKRRREMTHSGKLWGRLGKIDLHTIINSRRLLKRMKTTEYFGRQSASWWPMAMRAANIEEDDVNN